MYCRIACLVLNANDGGRSASGYLAAGSVPHVPSRRSSACEQTSLMDVEGDWVHQIKWPHIDKGKGRMETEDEDLDEAAAWARYRADIRQIVESNESITRSFEALVVLLADRLLASRMEHPGGVASEGEEEEEGDAENAEDGNV